jgi:hypothetical protein
MPKWLDRIVPHISVEAPPDFAPRPAATAETVDDRVPV